jgi:hypothetical protein
MCSSVSCIGTESRTHWWALMQIWYWIFFFYSFILHFVINCIWYNALNYRWDKSLISVKFGTSYWDNICNGSVGVLYKICIYKYIYNHWIHLIYMENLCYVPSRIIVTKNWTCRWHTWAETGPRQQNLTTWKVLCWQDYYKYWRDIMSCSPLKVNKRFKGKFCLHLQV